MAWLAAAVLGVAMPAGAQSAFGQDGGRAAEASPIPPITVPLRPDVSAGLDEPSPIVKADPVLVNPRNAPEYDADALAAATALSSLAAYNVADSVLEQAYRVGREDLTLEVQAGETVSDILVREGVSPTAAYNMVEALTALWDPRELQIGQKLVLNLDHRGTENEFLAFELLPEPDRIIQVRLEDDLYIAEEVPNQLERRVSAAQGKVTSNLSQALHSQGARDAVLIELTRRYSFSVDFQRDIQAGDEFQVLYDEEYFIDGDFARNGDILFVRLVLGGRDMPLYRFEDSDGIVDYYEPNGVSGQRLLMRTPIDGARISSNFGRRRHPILGYSHLHQGVDFAASTGTPIFAAGDGTVEFVGRRGGYGRYIRLRHTSQLHTAYAHLSAYAKGLSAGDNVIQGDIIGYVGSSGRSTGPHLHYEVLVDGAQVNPLSIDLPAGRTLEGADKARFIAHTNALNELFSEVLDDPQVARID